MAARTGAAAALVAGAIAGTPAVASAGAPRCDGAAIETVQSHWSPCYHKGNHPQLGWEAAGIYVGPGHTAWVWFSGSRRSHRFGAGMHGMPGQVSGLAVR